MQDIVYTRKYTDRNGNEKKEYINVGYMFEKDGRISLLMKSHINLAAFQNEKVEVWLNVYEHKQKADKPVKNGSSAVDMLTGALLRSKDPAEGVQAENGEDIPF